MPLEDALEQKNIQIRSLKQEYRISGAEDAQILAELFNQDGVLMRAADAMLDQLQTLSQREFTLTQGVPNPQNAVFELLYASVENHQGLVTTQLLSILEILGDQPNALHIAQSLNALAGRKVQSVLQTPSLRWSERLSPPILAALNVEVSPLQSTAGDGLTLVEDFSEELLNGPASTTLRSISLSQTKMAIQVLQEFFHEPDPLIQAASLYAIYQIDPQQGKQLAQSLIQDESTDSLVQDAGRRLLGSSVAKGHAAVQSSAPLVPLLSIDITLSGKTENRTFGQSEVSVGRDYNNDIVLADRRVSRNHAVLHCDVEGVSIQDLGSSNGLRIGTQVVRDRQEPIAPGTQIWFTPGQDTGLMVDWEPPLPTYARVSTGLGTLEKALKLFEVKFFKKLKTMQLVLLAQEAEVKTYQKGDVLYRQGAPANELMVVTQGTANAYVQSGNGQQWVGKIEQGETIGELGVLTQSTRSTTVIAADEMVQVLVIQSGSFEALLKSDAPMVRQFLLMISDRLQDTLTHLSDAKPLQS